MKISTIVKDKNGEFPSHAWPGCYPIVYFNCREDVLCPTCANKSIDLDSFDFCPTDYDVYYEGPALECDCCGELIHSAYGDPTEEEKEPQPLPTECDFCGQRLTPINIHRALEESGLPLDCLTLYCPSHEILASDSGPYERCHVRWTADETMAATWYKKYSD